GERAGLEEIDRLGESFDRLLERLDDAMSAERRVTGGASHEPCPPPTALSGGVGGPLERAPGAPEEGGGDEGGARVGWGASGARACRAAGCRNARAGRGDLAAPSFGRDGREPRRSRGAQPVRPGA